MKEDSVEKCFVYSCASVALHGSLENGRLDIGWWLVYGISFGGDVSVREIEVDGGLMEGKDNSKEQNSGTKSRKFTTNLLKMTKLTENLSSKDYFEQNWE